MTARNEDPIHLSGESVFLEANGLRHHMLRYGKAGDRDLVLIPGITSPAASADFLAVLLADLGFRVTVPDVRGRGDSDRAAPGGYRLVDYAADLAGICAGLGLVQPVIVGHSMGARIAAAYCVLHAGDDHALVVLVDPPTSGPDRGPYPTSRESFEQQLHEAYDGTDADAVQKFYPHWPRRELQIRAQVLASCDETAVLETHQNFQDEDFFGYWRQLSDPVVLVVGADSPVVPAQALAELRSDRPQVPVHVVPDAGHMVPWDNLQAFLDAVRPHLAAHS